MKMNLLRFFKLCRLVHFGSFWFILVHFGSNSFFPSLHLIIYRNLLPQIHSFFSYEMRSPIPLMSIFKTETVPMR